VRKVSLDRVKEGARVARTILSLDGIVLLSEGVEITEDKIQQLKHYNITERLECQKTLPINYIVNCTLKT